MSEDSEPVSPLVTASQGLLTERGPLTVAELLPALRESGLELGADAEELLEDELFDADSDALSPLLDDRWAHVPSLLAERIFTHRLAAAEVEHDLLHVNPDFEAVLALKPLPPETLSLAGGTPLPLLFPGFAEDRELAPHVPPEIVDDFGSLLLPAGTLTGRGARAGALIGLRATASGLELISVDEVDVSHDVDAVQDGLLSLVQTEPDRPQDVPSTVLTVCADLPDAFRDPLPPLSELFAASGLVHAGDYVAPPGFDFARHYVELRSARLRQTYELTADESLSVLALLRLHEQMAELLAAVHRVSDAQNEAAVEALRAEVRRTAKLDPDRGDRAPEGRTVASVLPFLAEPAVAEVLLTEAIGDQVDGAAALGLLADAMQEHAPRSVQPALRWLRAKAYERLGQVVEAEESLRAAHRLDPTWPPVLLDLARYASDRGDAVGGLDLLRRSDPEPETLLEQLFEAFQPTPGPTIGRNEPCWCGSGRKFKQCHLHRPQARPLEERAAWLYQKAGMFVDDGPWRAARVEVAWERAAYARGDDEVERAITDPLVTDAVLFEGGAFEEFLQVRGVLLPVDERLLAEQWLLIDRSVFEIVDVRPGASLTVRDLRTGDVHLVRERTASRQLRAGELLCARVVPAGDTMQIFGGLEPVTLRERDALLELLDDEPEPEELVAFLSRRFAPTRLSNTEGDPLVLCEATVAVADRGALVNALDASYRRLEGTEPPQWHEVRNVDGFDRIAAALRLTEDSLAISTTSETRLDAVLTQVRELQPGTTVLTDERQPVPDTRAVAELAERSGPRTGAVPAPEEQSPEIQAALAAYMRDYEQKWLDLPLPALGGRTPREAADDPTRREDLIQLLAEFPVDEQQNPIAMSPRRIKADLGLTRGGASGD